MARVQAVSNSSTGTGTVSVTITAATAGNLLVGMAACNEVAADQDINTPAGWSTTTLADTNATTKVRGRMFFKVAAGGETSAAFAAASGTPDMTAWIIEWSGISSAVEDLAAEATGSTSPALTGTIGSPAAGAVGFALIAINNNNNLTTPTNSYTLEGTVVSGNASAPSEVRLALLYNASPGATNTQLTQSGTARSYVGQLVTFKAGGGTAHAGAAALQGVGALTTAAILGAAGAAALQGVGTLTTAGKLAAAGATALQGVGTLTPTGKLAAAGAGALQGVGILTAAGTVSGSTHAPTAITSAYRNLVVADGPVSYWRLGEPSGSVAADSVGSNPGAYQSSPTQGATGLIAGEPDKAVAFNGSNGNVAIPFASSLNPAGAFSFEMWVKFTGTLGALVYFGENLGVSGKGYALLKGTDDVIGFATGGVGFQALGPAMVVGQLYHLVGVFDGGTGMVLYVNGLGYSGLNTGFVAQNSQDVNLGASVFNTARHTGTIDEVAFYAYALSEIQVAAHYAAGLSSASGITRTQATLAGTVTDVGGLSTTWLFEYGPTAGYGSTSAGGVLGAGAPPNSGVTDTISGLTPGATYHYRLKATNAAGTSTGLDQTFAASAAGVMGQTTELHLGRFVHLFVNGAYDTPTVGAFSCVETDAGGYWSAQGQIPAYLAVTRPDIYRSGTEWWVMCGQCGEVVWQGEIGEVTPGASVVSLTGIGAGQLVAETNVERLVYLDRKLSAWGVATGDPYGYTDADGYNFGTKGGHLLLEAPGGEPFGDGQKAGLAYWAPNVGLTNVSFTIQKNRDTSEFELRLYGATGPSGTRTLVNTWALTSANPDGTAIDYDVSGYDLLQLALAMKTGMGDVTLKASSTISGAGNVIKGMGASSPSGITVLSSSARTTSGTGSGVAKDPDTSEMILAWTAHSGTGETLDVLIQTSADGTNWRDVGSFSTLTNAAAASGSRTETFDRLDTNVRAKWTIAGTSPSWTFSIKGAAVGSSSWVAVDTLTNEIALAVSAHSGTSETLDVVIQTSADKDRIREVGNFDTVTSGAGGSYTDVMTPDKLDVWVRAVWTLTGTSPSFTFSVTQPKIAVSSVTDFGTGGPIASDVTLSWTAHSGTAETLDVEIQTTGDQSSTKPEWETIGSFDTVGNGAAASGSKTISVEGVRRYLRVRSTVRGSSPSFTFSVAGELGYRTFTLRLRNVRVAAIGSDDTTASDVVRDIYARAGVSDAGVEDTAASVMPLDVAMSTYGEPLDLMALYEQKVWGVRVNINEREGEFADYSDETWTSADPENPRSPQAQKQYSRVLVPFTYAGGHAQGLAEAIADPNPLGSQVTAPPVSLQDEPADDTLATRFAQTVADYLVQPRSGGSLQFSTLVDERGFRVPHHRVKAGRRAYNPLEGLLLRIATITRTESTSTAEFTEGVPMVARVNARRQRRLELRGK